MDVATLAMLNGLKKSGGVGHTESFTASYVLPAAVEDITSDVSIMGGSFKWFSSATPTKDEFLSGKLSVSRDGEHVVLDIAQNNPSVIAETDTAYAVQVAGIVYIVSTVLENELGTLPKIGMYYGTHTITDYPDSFLLGAVYTFTFTTIHPIDQKYLPGEIVINLADYGIDVSSLVNAGGGNTLITGTTALWDKLNEAHTKGLPIAIEVFSTNSYGTQATSFTAVSSKTYMDGIGLQQIGYSHISNSGTAVLQVSVNLLRTTNELENSWLYVIVAQLSAN